MTYALVTCSGISNTGKLTTQAALMLMQRRPEQYVWMHAKQSTATLEAEIGDADEVIVIDGCWDCCAKKKLSSSRIAPDHHIIATELGIEKKGMGEVQYDEIEKVVCAIMNNGSHKESDNRSVPGSKI
ncbi:MAG: putative zinc-binding protein [Methanoregula sp.]|nr:putative zinc-binding protein [Methanoregula sp.]